MPLIKTTVSHMFFYEFSNQEGMCTKTLKKRLRSKGYKGSFRGLLPLEIIVYLRNLLHDKSQIGFELED
jgi:hypothetical protein